MKVEVPGDKSITHRCLLLATQALGESRFDNLNSGTDVQATARALLACGAALTLEGVTGRVTGGPLRDPVGELDLGNSGTGARLLAGLLAGLGVRARLTGDASLRTRPMDRIVEPLRAMGADVVAEGEGRSLPLAIAPAELRPLDYALPVASAQVKSCLLLAGLAARVPVRLSGRIDSRDHTERLLSAMGAAVRREGETLRLDPGRPLRPLAFRVPGDFSAAAFWLALAALVPGTDVVVPGVGVNPGRTGFLDVLEAMGVVVRVSSRASAAGEPVADLVAHHAGPLHPVEVGPALGVRVLDEIPLVAVLASRAEGTSWIRGMEELRVKESDRLAVLAAGLRAVGAKVQELPDGLRIEGPASVPRGRVDTRLDHRIAMAFAVLGKVPGGMVELSETGSIETSFPGFSGLLAEASR